MGRTDRGSSPGNPDFATPGEAVRVAAEALRIDGLRKSFGAEEVLRGIDLAVAPHEVTCSPT
jgi:hypothetical protein